MEWQHVHGNGELHHSEWGKTHIRGDYVHGNGELHHSEWGKTRIRGDYVHGNGELHHSEWGKTQIRGDFVGDHLGIWGHLVEGYTPDPKQIYVINGNSYGARALLAADVAEAELVGIDSEWAPDWNSDSNNPISVLQLAFPISGRVYILQLSQMAQLPSEVQIMFLNSKVLKLGFAVTDNDCLKFQRSGIAMGAIFDLQTVCGKLLGLAGISIPHSLGLGRAARLILGENLNKDKRISCSDWGSAVLTSEQIHYAAMDAWILLRLYDAYSQLWKWYASAIGRYSEVSSSEVLQHTAHAGETRPKQTHRMETSGGKVVAVGKAVTVKSEIRAPSPQESDGCMPKHHSPRHRQENLSEHRDKASKSKPGKPRIVSFVESWKPPEDSEARFLMLSVTFVVFAMVVFPPGVPALIMLPLQLLLLGIMHYLGMFPPHSIFILSTYVCGCGIRVAAGMFSFIVGLWSIGRALNTVQAPTHG